MTKQGCIFLISLIICIYITPTTLSIESKTQCDPENHKKTNSLKPATKLITKKESLETRQTLNDLQKILNNENQFNIMAKDEFSKLDKDQRGLLCINEMKKWLIKNITKDTIRPPTDEEFDKLWDYIPREYNQKCIGMDGFKVLIKLLVKNFIVFLRKWIQIIEIGEFLKNSQLFEGVTENIFKKCDKEAIGKLDKEGVSKAINLMCEYMNLSKPNSVEFEVIYKSIPKKKGLVDIDDCRSSMIIFLSNYVSG